MVLSLKISPYFFSLESLKPGPPGKLLYITKLSIQSEPPLDHSFCVLTLQKLFSDYCLSDAGIFLITTNFSVPTDQCPLFQQANTNGACLLLITDDSSVLADQIPQTLTKQHVKSSSKLCFPLKRDSSDMNFSQKSYLTSSHRTIH